MATRGIFGFQHQGKLKAFFGTGSEIQYWLPDVIKIVMNYDNNKANLINVFNNIKIDSNYKEAEELEILLDFEKAIRGERANDDSFIDCMKPENFLRFFQEYDLTYINDSILGLNGLMIETAIIINLDKSRIDVFSGGVFKLNSQLKNVDSNKEFLKGCEDLGQVDNIFVDKYSQYFKYFKEASETLFSEEYQESIKNKSIDTHSKEHRDICLKRNLFRYGPVCKIASINFDLLPEKEEKSYQIFRYTEAKHYLDVKNLCRGIQYWSQKLFYTNDYNENLEENSYSEDMIEELKENNII